MQLIEQQHASLATVARSSAFVGIDQIQTMNFRSVQSWSILTPTFLRAFIECFDLVSQHLRSEHSSAQDAEELWIHP
jgi:hypothetical protein